MEDLDQALESPEYGGIRVKKCTDGKYRWTYPMNMLKNLAPFYTVCKILGILGGIAFVATYIGPAFHGNFAEIGHDLKYWGIAVLVGLAIAFLSYLIVAAMYKGRYIINFTMDENGLCHKQVEYQKKNARVIGGLVAGAGALTGNPVRVGQGMLVAGHTSLTTDFSKVRSIKPVPRLSTIKVNGPLSKNQVYTAPEDFDFVLDFIVNHCPNAK